jgi:hypothetical protein
MSTQHQSLTSKVFDLFQYEKVLQNSTIGFLLLLQLANKRKKLFIYRRGAHGLLKEGAPSGGKGLPSGESGLPPLPSLNKCQSTFKMKERAPLPLAMGCHLKRAPPLQEGRTSQGPQAQS